LSFCLHSNRDIELAFMALFDEQAANICLLSDRVDRADDQASSFAADAYS